MFLRVETVEGMRGEGDRQWCKLHAGHSVLQCDHGAWQSEPLSLFLVWQYSTSGAGVCTTTAHSDVSFCCLSFSSTQPGASLEQTHIFVLAHILRRPIIVYGVKYYKSFRGETLGYTRFQGEAAGIVIVIYIGTFEQITHKTWFICSSQSDLFQWTRFLQKK